MHNLRLGLSAIALLVAVPAFAADIPAYEPAPAVMAPAEAPVAVASAGYDWTGFYLGANGSYAWGKTQGGGFGSLDDNDGYKVGLHAGYNQGLNTSFGTVVFGLEADVSKAFVDDKFTPAAGVRARIDQTWESTVRARAGYALDNVMVYGTGGLAVTELKKKVTVDVVDVAGSDTSKDVSLGYAVGGGVEYAVSDNWSVRGQYLYTDYEKKKDVSADFHTVTAGVSYKF